MAGTWGHNMDVPFFSPLDKDSVSWGFCSLCTGAHGVMPKHPLLVRMFRLILYVNYKVLRPIGGGKSFCRQRDNAFAFFFM